MNPLWVLEYTYFSVSVSGYIVRLNQQTHSKLFIYERFTDSVGTLILLDEFTMQNQTETHPLQTCLHFFTENL